MFVVWIYPGKGSVRARSHTDGRLEREAYVCLEGLGRRPLGVLNSRVASRGSRAHPPWRAPRSSAKRHWILGASSTLALRFDKGDL